MRMPDDVCRVGVMCKDDLLEQSHSDRLTNTHWEVQKSFKDSQAITHNVSNHSARKSTNPEVNEKLGKNFIALHNFNVNLDSDEPSKYNNSRIKTKTLNNQTVNQARQGVEGDGLMKGSRRETLNFGGNPG